MPQTLLSEENCQEIINTCLEAKNLHDEKEGVGTLPTSSFILPLESEDYVSINVVGRQTGTDAYPSEIIASFAVYTDEEYEGVIDETKEEFLSALRAANVGSLTPLPNKSKSYKKKYKIDLTGE